LQNHRVSDPGDTDPESPKSIHPLTDLIWQQPPGDAQGSLGQDQYQVASGVSQDPT
jgi:hypothetical protein